MYCNNCGTQIDGNIKFCPKCGIKVLPKTQSKSEQNEQHQTTEISESKSKSKRKTAIAIIAVILSVVLVVGGVFGGIMVGKKIGLIGSSKNYEEKAISFQNEFNGVSDIFTFALEPIIDLSAASTSDVVETLQTEQIYRNYFGEEGIDHIEKDPKGKFEYTTVMDADNADWILENVFNKEPDRTVESECYYYLGDNLYFAAFNGGGGGMLNEVTEYYDLGDGKFGFCVLSYSEPCSRFKFDSNAKYHYIIATEKSDREHGDYWSFLNISENSCFDTANSNLVYTKHYDEYYNVVYARKSTLGYPHPIVGTIDCTGLIYVNLVDFNNDGVSELVLAYGENDADKVKYTYELWAIVDGKAVKVSEGTPFVSSQSNCAIKIYEIRDDNYVVTSRYLVLGTDVDKIEYKAIGYNGQQMFNYKSLTCSSTDTEKGNWEIDGAGVRAEEAKELYDSFTQTDLGTTCFIVSRKTTNDFYTIDTSEGYNILEHFLAIFRKAQKESDSATITESTTKASVSITEEELRTKAEDFLDDLQEFYCDDYDKDGTLEAFALCGDVSEFVGYENASVWFISATTVNVMKNDFEAFIYSNGIVDCGDRLFFSVERSGGGSGSVSYIYGVENGISIEPNISGNIRDFHRAEDGLIVGSLFDTNSKYTNYIYYEYKYDPILGDFVQMRELKSSNGLKYE